MTIRAKLFAAIALTVIGPLVTIGVALSAFGTLGDRFDDVERASGRQAVALDLKFAVTDMNGWQTAYGYGDGRFRDRFDTSAAETKRLLERAEREITAPPERALIGELAREFDAFMELVAVAIGAGIVIVLLLITVQDVVRLALERREEAA